MSQRTDGDDPLSRIKFESKKHNLRPTQSVHNLSKRFNLSDFGRSFRRPTTPPGSKDTEELEPVSPLTSRRQTSEIVQSDADLPANAATFGRSDRANSEGQSRNVSMHTKGRFHRHSTDSVSKEKATDTSRGGSVSFANSSGENRRPTYTSLTSQSSDELKRSPRSKEISDSTDSTMNPSFQFTHEVDPSEFTLAAENGDLGWSKVSYPNPKHVLDTRSISEADLSGSGDPSSRADSVVSVSSGKTSKKSHRSIFDKITHRRDSSTDATAPPTSQKPKKSKHRRETLKALGSAFSSTPSLSSLTPINSSKETTVFSSSQLANDDPLSSQNLQVTGLSSKYHGFSSSDHRRVDTNDNVDPLTKNSGQAPAANSSVVFTLDTDLGEMNGIVKGTAHPLHADDNESGHATSWVAPESWGVADPGEVGSVSRRTYSAGPMETSDRKVDWSHAFEDADTDKKTARFCLRVFREDKTFGTLSCPLDITAVQLIQLLGRKFFMSSTAGYRLTVKTGKSVRILQAQEKPLIYQKMLLEFIGFTEKERLGDVGREDLTYLCRFEFSSAPLRTLTQQEEREINRDWQNVDLHDKSLQTIPVMLFKRAPEIKEINLSDNPSLVIPLDFIQACTNMRSVKFTSNWIREIPLNLYQWTSLEHLDLSNNLISEIQSENLLKLKNLKSLNLQGNRLKALPNSISGLKFLEQINLSSNNIIDVSPLCEIISLKFIDLGFNRVETIPDNIGNLINLEKLIIPNNYLSKELPETFSKLQSLIELDIRYNKLQNIDVLARLENLQSLYGSKNSVHHFSDTFLKLRTLYFDRNPLTNFSFADTHFNLTTLNLCKAKLTQLNEEWIAKLPNLTNLLLDKNHLTVLPSNIATLRHLTDLSVASNALSSLPPEIGQLSMLKRLDLHSNNLKVLPSEIWNLGSLTHLNVSSNLLTSFPKRPNLVSVHGSFSESQFFKVTGTPPTTSSSLSGLSVSTPRGSTAGMDLDYEFKSIADRRPSAVSVASSVLSPKDGLSRRESLFPLAPIEPANLSYNHSSSTDENDMISQQSLSNSLVTLLAADNQLSDLCLEDLSLLAEIQVLNLSYNEIFDIPPTVLRCLPGLKELYLSGNQLASLPADDLEALTSLKILVLNSNKLHSLPAELGKMKDLSILDVGSNALRYNINNWPYDWNWNWNRKLKYLNFSGNRRLEIKRLPNQSSMRSEEGQKDLSDFTVLQDLRILGLMDVTLTVPSVPDQTENCRVRTYGSSILSMQYGMADSLGDNENLTLMDMVVERFRGQEKEAIIGLFDGRNCGKENGNKFSKLLQEEFAGMLNTELSKLRDDENVTDALRRAFLNVNKDIGNAAVAPAEEGVSTSIPAHRTSAAASLNINDASSGSCATLVYINDNKMYVANVGDSTAVLSKGNGEYTVLTKRHDPTSQTELARIRGGAGVVSNNGLLDGVLEVSRAIGFYDLVPHINSAPFVSKYDLTDADDFVILASKQLWEHMSYEEAVDVARTEMSTDAMTAAQKLRDFAIAYGCNDKIMVMVIGVGGFRRKSRNRLRNTVGNNGAYTFGNSLPISQFNASGMEEELSASLMRRRRDRSLLPEDSSLARLGAGAPAPVGEVAMVFTDIKNSTLLWETYPLAMRSAIKVHNNIMRRNILITGAYEVKNEGDAFIVSFSTPTSALLFCFSVQSQLLTADWPAEVLESLEGYPIRDESGELMFRGLSVRMGIHWGSPVAELDPVTHRMDYFGPMVNRTARISAVADGGQITVSRDFLSEIEKYQLSHKHYIENQDITLGEAYGDENLGDQIDQSIKLINTIGYSLHELGEMKLKGLENAELITAIYPSALVPRLKFHEQNSEEEVHFVRDKSQADRNNSNELQRNFDNSSVGDFQFDDSSRRPSKLGFQHKHIGSEAERVGGLTLDVLTQLRIVSHRIDKICSSMSTGMSHLAGTAPDLNRSYDSKTAGGVRGTIPNTDHDFLIFFDHLVTRVENAVGSLYLRATASALIDKYSDGNAYLSDLSDIMKSLEILAFNKESSSQSFD